MNLFLDSSVLLAACGSAAGASRATIESSSANSWQLLSSDYVFGEVEANLAILPAGAVAWPRIRDKLQKVPDVLTLEWPAIFAPARDRPVLFTAMAWAEVLLTLDRRDFAELGWQTVSSMEEKLGPGGTLGRIAEIVPILIFAQEERRPGSHEGSSRSLGAAQAPVLGQRVPVDAPRGDHRHREQAEEKERSP